MIQHDKYEWYQYIRNVPNLDYKALATALIEMGLGSTVAYSISSFPGLDRDEMAMTLIKNGEGFSVVQSLESFPGLDTGELARALARNDQVSAVDTKIHKFPRLCREVALALIDAGNAESVAYNLERFVGLDSEIEDY